MKFFISKLVLILTIFTFTNISCNPQKTYEFTKGTKNNLNRKIGKAINSHSQSKIWKLIQTLKNRRELELNKKSGPYSEEYISWLQTKIQELEEYIDTDEILTLRNSKWQLQQIWRILPNLFNN